jgi:Na+-transporting NADH:ubiquinone oxidoreductase subunit NqrE
MEAYLSLLVRSIFIENLALAKGRWAGPAYRRWI